MADIADTVVYCNGMEEIRQRVNTIKWCLNGIRLIQKESFFTVELVFMQLRKVLELIAFASMTSNKDTYSKAFDNYHKHWKARSMLKELAKINAEFYPMPVMPPVTQSDGTKMLSPVVDGFVTQDDFVRLYEVSSEVIHMRNPFSLKDPVTQLGYSVDEWVERIQRLVKLHRMTLLNGDQWVVEIPDGAPVKLWTAVPRNDASL